MAVKITGFDELPIPQHSLPVAAPLFKAHVAGLLKIGDCSGIADLGVNHSTDVVGVWGFGIQIYGTVEVRDSHAELPLVGQGNSPAQVRPGIAWTPVSYTHLTLPTICSV